jgi:hypothetical protein
MPDGFVLADAGDVLDAAPRRVDLGAAGALRGRRLA